MLFIYKLNNVHLFFSSHRMPAAKTVLLLAGLSPLLKSHLCLRLLDRMASLDMSSSPANKSLLFFPKKSSV